MAWSAKYIVSDDISTPCPAGLSRVTDCLSLITLKSLRLDILSHFFDGLINLQLKW